MLTVEGGVTLGVVLALVSFLFCFVISTVLFIIIKVKGLYDNHQGGIKKVLAESKAPISFVSQLGDEVGTEVTGASSGVLPSGTPEYSGSIGEVNNKRVGDGKGTKTVGDGKGTKTVDQVTALDRLKGDVDKAQHDLKVAASDKKKIIEDDHRVFNEVRQCMPDLKVAFGHGGYDKDNLRKSIEKHIPEAKFSDVQLIVIIEKIGNFHNSIASLQGLSNWQFKGSWCMLSYISVKDFVAECMRGFKARGEVLKEEELEPIRKNLRDLCECMCSIAEDCGFDVSGGRFESIFSGINAIIELEEIQEKLKDANDKIDDCEKKFDEAKAKYDAAVKQNSSPAL